jgi:DNA-binding transcriptional ArsR family regulator
MTDRGRPAAGFDPQRDVLLDARNLRGLAHPLRLRLLGALREGGPSTATLLAARLGESSAATSYHLRQLEAYGFVAEEAGRGRGRERWWRSAHRSTYFDLGAVESDEGQLLGEEYLRGVARAYAARMEAWIDALPTVPTAWRDAATMSDYRMRLTPEQAVALVAQLDAIGIEHRDDPDADRSGDPAARRVAFQFQVLPDPRDVAEAADHG